MAPGRALKPNDTGEYEQTLAIEAISVTKGHFPLSHTLSMSGPTTV